MVKRYFLAGIATLLPIAITAWIVTFFFDLLTHPFTFLAQALVDDLGLIPDDHPVILFLARLLILIALLLLCLVAGYVGQKFLFRYFMSSLESVLKRIPLVNTIYRLTEQTIGSFVSDNSNPFQKPVIVEFPLKNSFALGFHTGKALPMIQKIKPEVKDVVFIPTSPHPISGFLLLLSDNQHRPLTMTAEEAFKVLLSCGSYAPIETTNIDTQ